MILPYGVTGFYNAKENPPPSIDGKQFKQSCFSVIKSNGGKVFAFKEPQTAKNFFEVEVNVFEKHIYILLNAHYPFKSFASSVEYGNVTFINVPQLNNKFSSYYRVLSLQELNEPLLMKKSERKNSCRK